MGACELGPTTDRLTRRLPRRGCAVRGEALRANVAHSELGAGRIAARTLAAAVNCRISIVLDQASSPTCLMDEKPDKFPAISPSHAAGPDLRPLPPIKFTADAPHPF